MLGVVLELERHTGLTLSSENPGGRNFYRRSWSLKTTAGSLAAGAFVAVGGNGDTVCVNLPGTSTALVRDWSAFRSWLEGIGAKITRVDLAHDCHEGQHTVDDAVEWYKSGQFAGQGRPPKCSQAGNWITPDDEEGRTFYVGKRENGKLFRAYEKGKQLGDAQSPWVRFEVELRSQDRTIPLDVLTRPGEYLAGAYPALSWIQQLQDKVKTWAKVAKITYDKLLREGRRAYGRLVNLMVDLGHTHQAIVETLQRSDGYPKSLESIPIVCGQGVAA
ncbi:MAG: replication initiation factor domain-containing protein [Pseudomonadota bacterium]